MRLVLLLLACVVVAPDASGTHPKKVVLIAGPLDATHPRGTHEYEKSVELLKRCLDTSLNVKDLVRAEVHFNGWPADPKTLDDADTIVLISTGGDRKREDHPLLVGDRAEVLDRHAKRGCGVVLIHWTTFAPDGDVGDKFLDWVGGYFDHQEKGEPSGWYSRIKHATTTAKPATPEHPISRGLKPFDLREEYYYRIRFRDDDERRIPILITPIPDERGDQVVAWAVQRERGRGFAFTGGHFFDNWWNDDFRRIVLNAIVWTAGVEVPQGGVASDPGPREPKKP